MASEDTKKHRKKLRSQGYIIKQAVIHNTELKKFSHIKKLFKKYQKNKNFNINDSFFDELIKILDEE